MNNSINTPKSKKDESLYQKPDSLQENVQPQDTSIEQYQDVIDSVFEKITNIIDYTTASVQIIRGNSRILIGSRGFSMKASRFEQRQGVFGDPLVRQVVQKRHPLVLPDVGQDPNWIVVPATAHVKSWMGIPLVLKDEVIGLITIDHNIAGHYTQEIGEQVFKRVNQLSGDIRKITLDQAGALGELDKSDRQLKQLLKVGKIVNSTLKFDEVIDLVLAQLKEVVEYDSASIQLIQGAHRIIIRGRGFYEDLPHRFLREASHTSFISEIVEKQEPYVFSDVNDTPEIWRDDIPEIAEIGSWIGAPLVFENKVIGLLTAGHKQVGEYTRRDRDIVAALADLVAIAVHNSSQMNALTKLNDLSQEIVSIQESSLGTTELLTRIAKSAFEILKADIVVLYEYVEVQDEFKLPPITEWEKLIGPEVPKTKIIRGIDIVDKFIHKERTEYIEDVPNHPDFAPIQNPQEGLPKERFVVREKIESAAVIPLRTSHEAVGLMFVSYRTFQKFVPEQKNLIELFAHYAAIAIKNTRLYSIVSKENAQLLETEKQQRKRAEVLQKVAQIANSTPDNEQLANLVLAQLQEVIQYSQASLQLIQGNRRTLIGYRDVSSESASHHLTSFTLTKRVFEKLRDEGISAEILQGLHILENQEFIEKNQFLEEVKAQIHQELTEREKGMILNYARYLLRNISNDPLIYKIVQNQQPEVISNTSQHELWEQLSETSHIKSWIGVPLVAQNQVIGLLTIEHSQSGYYTEESGKIALAFANQLATAILNNERVKAFAVLNKLSDELLFIGEKSPDTKNLLEQIAQYAGDILNADLIELYEYHQAQNKFELPHSAGDRIGPSVSKKIIYEDDVVFNYIKSPEPVYVHSSQTEQAFLGNYLERKDKPKERFIIREKIRSTAVIPLKTKNEIMGLMFINYRTPQRFTQEQCELIELFADQAAIAIKNVQLYSYVNQRREALVKIGQKLTSDIYLKEEEILESIYEQASSLLDMKANFSIGLYDKVTDTFIFKLAYVDGQRVNFEKESGWKPRPGEQGKSGEVIRTGIHLLLNAKAEIRKWGFEKSPGHKDSEERIPDSWIGVPMKFGDQILGVIATYHYGEEHFYNDDDVEVLQALGDQAAIAIYNARLMQRQDILIDLGQQLTSGIQQAESDILTLIHKQASQLMNTNNMYIALYDELTDKVRFPLAFRDGKPIVIETRKAGQGRTEEIIRTQKPIFQPTKAENIAWYCQPGRKDYFKGEMWLSWIGVPMIRGNKVLGIIATYHITMENAYSKDDLKILQSMANSAAIALENARLVGDLKNVQGEIANRERELVMSGVAMDFAHRINNLVGTIPPWVSLIKRRLKSENKEDSKVNEYLEKIDKDAAVMLQETYELRKPVAEPQDVNVEDVVGSIVGQVEMMASKDVKIVFTADSRLPSVYCVEQQLATAIYGVIQNAVKAISQQGTISILLRQLSQNEKTVLQIEITDTGCGIPQDQFETIFEFGKIFWADNNKRGMGYGLWRTRNILQSISGTIKVKYSEIGKGTTFIITLPTSTVIHR